MVMDWAGCLPESDVQKEYENVDKLAYLGLTIDASCGSLAEKRHQITLEKISDNQTMECLM